MIWFRLKKNKDSPKWSIIFSKWFNIYCRTISGLSVKNSEAKIWSQIRLASLTRRQLLYALLNENRKCRLVFNLKHNWVSTSKILIFTFRYHYSNLASNERRDLWDFFHKHIVAIELESNSLQHFQIVHLYLNKNCISVVAKVISVVLSVVADVITYYADRQNALFYFLRVSDWDTLW